MPEVRTEVVVTAKAKGFEQVQQQAARVNQGAARALDEQAKGFSDAEKKATAFGRAGERARRAFDTQEIQRQVSGLRRHLQDLATEQLALGRVMEQTADKAGPGYRKLNDEMRRLQGESSRVERTIRNLETAFKDQARSIRQSAEEARQARGAFLQGFVQGAVPGGAFLQRGPGMRTQVMGLAAGRALRGTAAGMMAAPFTGAQGIAQAISTIPGGGFLALPLIQSMQRAQQAVQFQQIQLQTLPFLGGMGLQQRIRGARRRAGRGLNEEQILERAEEARLDAAFQPVDPGRIQGIVARAREKAVEDRIEELKRQGMRFGRGPFGTMTTAERAGRKIAAAELEQQIGGAEGLEQRAEVVARMQVGEEAQVEAVAAGRRERRRRQIAAAARERQRIFQPIRQAGVELLAGGAPEATQLAAQISELGGGTGIEMRRQGLVRAGFAARTLFGVGPDVTGAFLQAGRRGGLVGGAGRAGEALTDTLRQAMELGLEGSEINDYLRAVAEGITSWKQTGIPINSRSIASMGQSLASLGLGGVRGGVMARGITAAAQQLTQRGPQSAEELVMLQTLGGFRGGGAAAFEEAQARLERGEFGAAEMQRLFQTFTRAGGGGAAGRFAFRAAMGRMGVRVGVEETRLLERQMRGEPLSAAERERLEGVQTQMQRGSTMAPQNLQQLTQQAAGAISEMTPALRRQAQLTNQQIDTGAKMVKAMQDLEGSTGNITKLFADELGPVLRDVTGAIYELSAALPELVARIKSLAHGDLSAMVAGG